jgi:hypothetical protein
MNKSAKSKDAIARDPSLRFVRLRLGGLRKSVPIGLRQPEIYLFVARRAPHVDIAIAVIWMLRGAANVGTLDLRAARQTEEY